MRLDAASSGGIPEPPNGYVPPMGSSRNTWTNIYKNKGRIDYCVQQFQVDSQQSAGDRHSGYCSLYFLLSFSYSSAWMNSWCRSPCLLYVGISLGTL